MNLSSREIYSKPNLNLGNFEKNGFKTLPPSESLPRLKRQLFGHVTTFLWCNNLLNYGRWKGSESFFWNSMLWEFDVIPLVYGFSRLHHPNVVELVGYCSEHGQHDLVYEFFKNDNTWFISSLKTTLCLIFCISQMNTVNH